MLLNHFRKDKKKSIKSESGVRSQEVISKPDRTTIKIKQVTMVLFAIQPLLVISKNLTKKY